MIFPHMWSASSDAELDASQAEVDALKRLQIRNRRRAERPAPRPPRPRLPGQVNP